MKTCSRMVLFLLAWGLTLFATLQIGNLPFDWGHVCGPWGCGPQVKPLVAWHGFWAILLTLPITLAIVYWPATRLQWVGLVLTAVGLLGLAGIVVCQAVVWLPRVSESDQSYFVARCLFSVVTLVDVPIVQVTLAGIVCWFAGFLRLPPKRSFNSSRPVPDGASITVIGTPGFDNGSDQQTRRSPMETLLVCRECRRPVHADAHTCPFCGGHFDIRENAGH